MTISKNINPFDFLCSEAWECGDLAQKIADNDKREEFDDYVEEYFNGQLPSETELNDFLRFNDDIILSAIGIEDEDEADD